MKRWISYALVAGFIAVMGLRLLENQSHDWSVPQPLGMTWLTWLFVINCALTVAICLHSAVELLGPRAAAAFVAITVGLGAFFETTGVKYAWWFGEYSYSDVLGWKLAGVPVIVPLMWFALAYMGYIISNLMMFNTPVHPQVPPRLPLGRRTLLHVVLSIPPAMIVLAYDLGADPYMVLIRAWTSPRGVWQIGLHGVTFQRGVPGVQYFHESIQGFRGWFFAVLCMMFVFRLVVREPRVVPATKSSVRAALWPIFLYWGFSWFQYVFGQPPDTTMIAAVAMGIPVVFGIAGWVLYYLTMSTAGSDREGATT